MIIHEGGIKTQYFSLSGAMSSYNTNLQLVTVSVSRLEDN